MVRKLLKYDFLSYMKKMIPVWLAVIGIGISVRILYIFETDAVPFKVASGAFIFTLVTGCIAAVVLSVVFSIVRFYSNLYSNEGYLSMTLPVTPSQHIWSKIISGTCIILLTFVCILISLSAATAGELLIEIWKAIIYMIKELYKQIGMHLVAFIAYVITVFVLFFANALQLFLTCLTIGQKAKRAKVGLAIGVFFIYYFAMQFIATSFIIIFTFVDIDFVEKLYELVHAHPIASLHIIGGCVIAWQIIYGTICFIITKHIMKKKLNLE